MMRFSVLTPRFHKNTLLADVCAARLFHSLLILKSFMAVKGMDIGHSMSMWFLEDGNL